MGRDPAEQTAPDLFSTNAVRDASPSPTATEPTANKSSQRHILPKNLRHSIRQLSDGELDELFEAAFDEAKRRGRLPRDVETDSAPLSRPSHLATKRTPSADKQREVDISKVSLTLGQVNAVRAAFKAGITPSRIARQFGISQSDVRKALASDESKR
jgi:predicted DNA-binding protein (UPF0251 family)